GRHYLQEAKAKEQHAEKGGQRNQQTMDNLPCHTPPTDAFGHGAARRRRRRPNVSLPGDRASSDVRDLFMLEYWHATAVPSRQTAGVRQHMASNEACAVGAEETDSGTQLLGLAQPPER